VYFLVVWRPGAGGHFFSPRDERNGPALWRRTGVYSAMDQAPLDRLTFPETAGERGNDLAEDLADGNMPPLVVVAADSVQWRSALERIPALSGVIAPGWFDWRSEAVLESWQREAVSLAEARRFRLFAVEYEPYDLERAGIVYQYVSGFCYRCEPDSGFSFLIRADVECFASDCSTCPAFGGN
jgi:hypothetical protein